MEHVTDIMETAHSLAKLDVISSLGRLAAEKVGTGYRDVYSKIFLFLTIWDRLECPD